MLEVFLLKKIIFKKIVLTCNITRDNDLVTTSIHYKAIKKNQYK